jgi:hypothetical protein
MKYYWMSCEIDERWPLWLFFENQDRRAVREQFQRYECPKCEKVDEFRALKAGLPLGLSVRAKTNVVRSYDGMLCADKKATRALATVAKKDVEFIAVGTEGWTVLHPIRRVEVKDPKKAGMLVTRECPVCHRPREVKRWPKKEHLRWPRKVLHVALVEPCLEDYGGRRISLLVSEEIVSAVNRNRLIGPHFRPLIEAES